MDDEKLVYTYHMVKALELENVYYKQGSFYLNDINLQVNKNDTIALVGKSGAGKSTLIRLIGNAAVSDSGIIRYFGKELYEDEKAIRASMSVIYDESNFNTEMKGISLAKEIKKFEPNFSMEKFSEYMSELELDANMRIRFYSKGMQRKYALALALARSPKLLVMDEVTSGVDEASRDALWKLVDEYRTNNELTIIFSTHHEKDIESIGARKIIIDKGELL